MKFRKKPVVIEAFQLTAESRRDNSEWPQWAHEAWNKGRFGALYCSEGIADGPLFIRTLEGEMRVDFGDWIIRGVKGELYPCKPDIFVATYEAVLNPDTKLPAEFNVNLTGCARCGGDHSVLVFRRLARGQTGVEHYTHWARCPTNGEPILMRAEQGDD